MGEVYEAEDQKLKRRVALKFLRADALEDNDHKKRFLREAQAAAALDHPNICTVYEIDEAEGQTFMAMALIAGQRVREKIRERPLKLGDALNIAIEAAEALAAAHEKGIVHRDIKSANLMLTQHGHVRLMDFGLARLTDRTQLTQTALFLGTPAYMSPEQAQRQEVDRRTDIWSLGVVLYEMVTGRLPFAGEHEQAVLYGIVNEAPEPPTALRSGLPVELDRIVTKAMAKHPSERYQHADELLVDLRALRNSRQPDSTKTTAAGSPAATSSRLARLWPAAVLVIALAAFLAGWLLRPAPEVPSSTTVGRVTPLTTYPGREIFPTFSPEGDRVAFAWEGENRDNWDIYVKLIGEDSRVRLTTHPAVDSQPAWSSDGRRIAFLRCDAASETGAVMLVPSIGGSEREVLKRPLTAFQCLDSLNEAVRALSWHPDSEHLVVAFRASHDSPQELHVVNVATGSVRRLFAAETLSGDNDPAVSPDGLHLAFRRVMDSFAFAVFVVGLSESIEVTAEPRNVSGEMPAFSPAWSSDSRDIVFAAGLGEAVRLWQVSLQGGEIRALSQPPQGAFPAISAAGNKVAFALITRDFDICQARLPGFTDAKSLISSTFYDVTPQYSPDGNKIAFSSSRSGYREIWLCDRDGSNPVQLTRLESRQSSFPNWSPDGSRIVFQSYVGNQRDIFVVPSGGGKRNL